MYILIYGECITKGSTIPIYKKFNISPLNYSVTGLNCITVEEKHVHMNEILIPLLRTAQTGLWYAPGYIFHRFIFLSDIMVSKALVKITRIFQGYNFSTGNYAPMLPSVLGRNNTHMIYNQ